MQMDSRCFDIVHCTTVTVLFTVNAVLLLYSYSLFHRHGISYEDIVHPWVLSSNVLLGVIPGGSLLVSIGFQSTSGAYGLDLFLVPPSCRSHHVDMGYR